MCRHAKYDAKYTIDNHFMIEFLKILSFLENDGHLQQHGSAIN